MPTSLLPPNLENMIIGMLVISSDNGRGRLRRKINEGQRRPLLWAREAMS
jgi:hypothetical protein